MAALSSTSTTAPSTVPTTTEPSPEQLLLDSLFDKSFIEEKKLSAQQRIEDEEAELKLLLAGDASAYRRSYDGVKEWLTKYKQWNRAVRETDPLYKPKEPRWGLYRPPRDSELAKHLFSLCQQLEYWLSHQLDNPVSPKWSQPILTLDDVVELWIYGNTEHRQITDTQKGEQPSMVELMWLTAAFGNVVVRNNPEPPPFPFDILDTKEKRIPGVVRDDSLGKEYHYSSIYTKTYRKWLEWSLTMEFQKVTSEDLFTCIAHYTIYIINNKDFKEVSITTSQMAMLTYLDAIQRDQADPLADKDKGKEGTEGEGEEKNQREASLSNTAAGDINNGNMHLLEPLPSALDALLFAQQESREGKHQKDTRKPSTPSTSNDDTEKKKREKTEPLLSNNRIAGLFTDTTNNRESIRKAANTILSKHFSSWSVDMPLITITRHLIDYSILKRYPHVTYRFRELDSFKTVYNGLKNYLHECVQVQMSDINKGLMRELVFELSLPLGATELEHRDPNIGDKNDYTALYQDMNTAGKTSVLQVRMTQPTSQIVTDKKTTTAIESLTPEESKESKTALNQVHVFENMVVPAVWLAVYRQWISSIDHINWSDLCLVTPQNMRYTLRNNILDTNTRQGKTRTPIIILIGNEFWIHWNIQPSMPVLIKCIDIWDALSIWTHLISSGQYKGIMDSGVDINERWIREILKRATST